MQPLQQDRQPAEVLHPLNLLGVLHGLLTIVVVAVFVLTFLAQPFRIPSESMEPTLLIGDFVLVDKVALAPAGKWSWLLPYRNVKRGEVAVFRRQADSGEEPAGSAPAADRSDAETRENYLVKRMVAVPGDRIRLQQGRLELNGKLQPEPYAMFLASGPDAYRDEFPASLYIDAGVDAGWWVRLHKLLVNGSLVVPEQEYFALGDNRNHSLDSRYWGFVPREQIVGPAMLVYFSVRTPSPDEAELEQATTQPMPRSGRRNDTMSKPKSVQAAGASQGMVRWERLFHLVQ